jgi:uncharacterized membrane protein
MSKFRHLNFLGLCVGLLITILSLTPSLIPRAVSVQSLVSAACFAAGYGVGTLLSFALQRAFRPQFSIYLQRTAWRALLALIPITIILYSFKAAEWQNQSRLLVDLPPVSWTSALQFLILTTMIATLFLALARLTAKFMKFVSRTVRKVLPPRIGKLIGGVLSVVAVIFLARAIALNLGIGWADRLYVSINETTPAGVVEPVDNPYRSGGRGSLVSWDSLGKQGRRFIGSEISAARISSLTKRPAREPIRVYIGVKTSRDATQQADLAVQELQRTGAFERKVLLVAMPTGTGWLNPGATDAFDYVYGGDTATAAIQYSYLPSWISFLADRQRAAEAGRELFNAVHAVWKTLPVETRPKLLVYGLSLGSYAIQEAFSGVDDLTNRTDGALFAGTPNSTRLWRQFEQNRAPGSPQWQPIYDDGRTVRWFARDDDFAKLGDWPAPHVGYLQHASDGVIWWDWNLLWQRPEWLHEPRGADVNPAMRWYPLVTFVQVLIDQATANRVPSGHGHNYEKDIVGNWNAILPSGLPDETLRQIQAEIDTYPLV